MHQTYEVRAKLIRIVTFFRLLYVWIDGVDTIRVVFETSFINDFPYDPLELISFAVLG